MSAALEGLRVLDLTNASGHYCGKMFGDLGADVILVEPPTGSAGRSQAPFLDDRVDPEFSLPFSYYNAGKRSVCLDLACAEDRDRLRKLIPHVDVLLESTTPGAMAEMGLDFESLSGLNPKLVLTSITPFGQSGPYASYVCDDIVALALGGMLYLGGYHDSPPIAVHGNQAWLAASQFAAVATMMAVYGARRSGGQGRHVDVSMQECVVMGMENAVQFYDLEGVVRRREAGRQRWAGIGVFDCADGQVYLMAGGIVPAQMREANVRWMIEGGIEEAKCMLDPQWGSQDFQATAEAKETFARLFGAFAETRTKAELYAQGQARRIPICPVSTPKDIMQNCQMVSRGLFVPLAHGPSGRTLQAPGAPYILSATPWRGGRAAPLLGEHTEEVLDELGAVGADA